MKRAKVATSSKANIILKRPFILIIVNLRKYRIINNPKETFQKITLRLLYE